MPESVTDTEPATTAVSTHEFTLYLVQRWHESAPVGADEEGGWWGLAAERYSAGSAIAQRDAQAEAEPDATFRAIRRTAERVVTTEVLGASLDIAARDAIADMLDND